VLACAAVHVKCCRSNPRCRDCPARKIEDDRLLLALGIAPEPPLPAHLRGVPRSLHKYEPLLRRAWNERVEGTRTERLELELVPAAPAGEPAAR
jgi:hypothetical protein